MDEVESLDCLMGPEVRSDYPGPTLADLLPKGFSRFGPFAIKRDGSGKVSEVYKRERAKPYYNTSTLQEYKEYKEFYERIVAKLRQNLSV